MTTDILGISAFYHDTAAYLIRDGRIVPLKKNGSHGRSSTLVFLLRRAGTASRQVGSVLKTSSILFFTITPGQIRMLAGDLRLVCPEGDSIVCSRYAGMAEGETIP